MRVDTTNYYSVHLHQPRGVGQWSFLLGRNGAYTTFRPSFAMSYTDAKREALREARSLGCDYVGVEA
jgi:hypothetical protein